MPFLLQLILLTALAVSVAFAIESEQSQHTRLRGLLDRIVSSESTPEPVRVLSASWEEGKTGVPRQLVPISEKIMGGGTVVLFNDRRVPTVGEKESAVVNFDVRSIPNCVVSVCGEMSQWYLGSKEKCFDLRIAPKSADRQENGLIRGLSAAYSGLRPVATTLYLKFDETNFIDGSKCEYEILAGTKTVREDQVASGSEAAIA
ncbi:hypothetical protein CCR75_001613 [Bremia lactucae]|uniref:RXLR effector n=1 Tax=Bremia lactucae TaxID=4779 RepID=A0A976FPN4_BRELC|nr:hypothetical protein CCR75_001613 [Bremia lactucae]